MKHFTAPLLSTLGLLACATASGCQMDSSLEDSLQADDLGQSQPAASEDEQDELVSIKRGMPTFEQDATPVDMREYWPSSYRVTHYRRADGSLYMKRITKPTDPMERWIPKGDPRDEHFSREDHIPIAFRSEETRFDNAWSMVKKVDGAVWEVGDLFADRHDCKQWCFGHAQIYTSSASPAGRPGILHGRPGGHRVGEAPYVSHGVKIASTNDLNSAPTPLPGWSIYTEMRLVRKYNGFKPEYGRAKDGRWGRGLGKTYRDVVLVAFQHGTSSPTPRPTCSFHPPGFAPVPGSRSFWQYSWLAPGVGVIQSALLWDERTCEGFEQPKGNVNKFAYGHFIDER